MLASGLGSYEHTGARATYAPEKVVGPLGASQIISGLRINHSQQSYKIPTVQSVNK